jgi:hypothetical protein
MTTRTILKTSKDDNDSVAEYALVYWPEEDSVSIVKTKDILHYSNSLSGGDTVQVKVGRRPFRRTLKVTGTIRQIRQAEEEYLSSAREIPHHVRRPLVDCTNSPIPNSERSYNRKRQCALENKVWKSAPRRKRNVKDKACLRGSIIVVDCGQQDNEFG